MVSRDAAIAALVLVALLVVGLYLGSSQRDFLIRLCIFGLFALSLNLLIGYTGLVSFGHALFFAGGAYCFVYLMQTTGLSIPAALVLTVLINAALALCVGALSVRSSEIYFTFLTLAIQMMFYSILYAARDITGGDQGLIGGVPRPVFLGVDLSQPYHFYAFCCVLTVGATLLLRALVESWYGYALRMIRDNAQRAAFLGIHVQLMRISAITIAGAVASISGAMMGLFVSGAYPNFAYWTQSGNAIFMVMLGGISWFLGPFIGAAFLLLMNDTITAHTEHYGFFLGAAILLVTLGLRKGLGEAFGDIVIAIRSRALSQKWPWPFKRRKPAVNSGEPADG